MLRVSRINLVINAIGVAIALGMLVLVPLPPWLQMALAVAFLAAFLWDLRLILFKSRQSVKGFYLFDLEPRREPDVSPPQTARLGVRLRYANPSALLGTREADGVILKGAFVSPWFTAVRYALPQDPSWRKWWPHIIPLWADSIPGESFRKVRVALKWK